MEAAVVGDGACASLVNTLGLGALLTAVARPVEEPVIGVEHDHVLLLILIDVFLFVDCFCQLLLLFAANLRPLSHAGREW